MDRSVTVVITVIKKHINVYTTDKNTVTKNKEVVTMAKIYTTMRMIKRKRVWGCYFYIGYKKKEVFVYKFTEEDLCLEENEVISTLELWSKYKEAYQKLESVYKELEDDVIKALDGETDFTTRVKAEFRTMKEKEFGEGINETLVMDLLIKYGADKIRSAYKNNERVLKIIDNIQTNKYLL